jgi:hypothetical protein
MTKHNRSGTKEYRAFVRMLHRCTDKSYPEYHRYGGRGIDVCARWSNPERGFVNFYEDMGPAPTPEHTLDRRENDRGYWCGRDDCPDCGKRVDAAGARVPANCRWATWAEQGNNRSTNVRHTHRGLTKTLTEWAVFLGFGNAGGRKLLHKRYKKMLAGDARWPAERVFSPWPGDAASARKAAYQPPSDGASSA